MKTRNTFSDPQVRQPGSKSASRRLLNTFAACALLAAASAVSAQAQVRTEFPGVDPGPPFYARVERSSVHTEIVPHTDEWAAVVFYRSPSCLLRDSMPTDFNLMELFDIPRAFGCPLTIEGFEVWPTEGPPADPAPMQARFNGLGAVPVWFVSWPELQGAVADDVLTMSELLALSSLQTGTADFFRETLHATDGAQRPKLTMVARGTLTDGRTFRLQHTGTAGTRQTEISFS